MKKNIKKEMFKEFKKGLCRYAAYEEADDEMLSAISHIISIYKRTDSFVEYMFDNHKDYFVGVINGNYAEINMDITMEIAESIYDICGNQNRRRFEIDEIIERKQRLSKGIYKALHKQKEVVLDEIKMQIEVCEDMGNGIPESKIKELILSCDNEMQVERRVRDYKFA